MSFFTYLTLNTDQIFFLLSEHIVLTVSSVLLAIGIGVPLGVLICRAAKISRVVLGTVNIIQAIPSLALLGAAIPLLGIGKLPAIIIVMLYSLLPIVKNTYTGIKSISEETVEAAYGIGLTGWQVLIKVQIPMALPIIMAGVRIAAVTAVGLVTIAAFIGAGGLGFLVFSGISTVNNNIILAGAIPACLLALLTDFIAGFVEKKVTPEALQPICRDGFSKTIRSLVLIISCFVVIGTVGYFTITHFQSSGKKIVVGSKDFTEQNILGHLIAEIIERKTSLKVDRKINLGGTQICFHALRSGDIDLYVDYTGTAYVDTLEYSPVSDMEHVYNVVKKDFKEKYGIKVLRQMSFNNTYTLSMSRVLSTKLGLRNISDLRNVANNLEAGVSFEFLNREDGLPGLEERYGFSFKKRIAINGSQRYVALNNGEVQVIDAFSTDGLLKRFNLVSLEDDNNFFPPYYAIPLVNAKTLDKYPEIAALVESLGEVLTNEQMIELNYAVDELQRNPRDVAIEFLQAKGLI